jgi:hypothetical protein
MRLFCILRTEGVVKQPVERRSFRSVTIETVNRKRERKHILTAIISILMMEAVRPTETFVSTYEIARCYGSEDRNLFSSMLIFIYVKAIFVEHTNHEGNGYV